MGMRKMTDKLFSNVLGCYIPAFFEMHVDTNDMQMVINKMKPRDRTILFHEYIHFLQDFTTYFGQNRLYVYSEYVHGVVNSIYKSASKTFSVPYIIKDMSDNVFLNQYIVSFTLGDGAEMENFNVATEPEVIYENVDYGTPHLRIPQIVVSAKNGDKRIFGGYAIMESMAYIMERLCSPDVSLCQHPKAQLGASRVFLRCVPQN